MTTTAPTTTPTVLPAGLRLGAVHLVVTDLDRAVRWYAHNLGLHVLERDERSASLGDPEATVLVLDERPAARQPGAEAGLYHVALLYPSRAELARATVRLATHRTPIQGASDHRTHEAIYLADADGNGLELAADRPRELWPADLGYTRGPAPLDVADLLATIAGENPTPQVGVGLRTGHLHLHVGDIPGAVSFYRDTLGFTLTADLGSAAFFAAGGYHHHLGVNVWRGRGIDPAGADVVGLGSWSAVLPTPNDVAALADRARSAGADVQDADDGVVVTDPWGMRLLVRADDAAPPPGAGS